MFDEFLVPEKYFNPTLKSLFDIPFLGANTSRSISLIWRLMLRKTAGVKKSIKNESIATKSLRESLDPRVIKDFSKEKLKYSYTDQISGLLSDCPLTGRLLIFKKWVGTN